jgi:Mg2+ and Co2+ transporter CorA
LVTIIIAAPMMIAGYFGMNVLDLPLSDKPIVFEAIF